jgi:methylenetetrahydrofolate dehydrogenase (NADP+)/methenyltetrahydrofolate cyclohydrolase
MIAEGKKVAEALKEKIKQNLSGNERVCFVIFGNDPGSRQFIKMKCRFAEGLGIHTFVEEHPENVTFDEAKNIVEKVVSENYSGIVIQLPLPKNLNPQEILNLVPPNLDIDVLSQNSKELYKSGQSSKVPPVARAVSSILEYYNIDLDSKNVLVIGKGLLVGEPVSNMLNLQKTKFSQIDKNTKDEEKYDLIKKADVIISGAGDSYFIKPEMIKDGVVIIDAGTSESEGKIVGDVDPSCFEKASLATPVPGGIGPVTLAALFLNL